MYFSGIGIAGFLPVSLLPLYLSNPPWRSTSWKQLLELLVITSLERYRLKVNVALITVMSGKAGAIAS